MKRQYETPMAYVELFTPNQFAGNCQPGVPEDNLEPKVVDCWFNSHNSRSYDVVAYNFQQGSCSRKINNSYQGCSQNGNSLTLITGNCDVDFSGGQQYGDGVNVYSTTISHKERRNNNNVTITDESGAMYVWPNGNGAWHYAMASEVIPGQSTDSQGRPYYFNS